MRGIDTLTVRRLAIAGAMTVIAAAPAHAALMTYYMSIVNQSGSVGGTSFSNATIHLQYTGDTDNISGGGYSITGDEIRFTITGGNVASDITGTFLGNQNWSFDAYQATGAWVFSIEYASFDISMFGFKAPLEDRGTNTFLSSTTMMTSAYSETVTAHPAAGQSSPSGSSGFEELGGASPFANWAGTFSSGVNSSLGTFSLTTPSGTTYYNGSFGVPYSPSAVPGAGLAGLATIGLAGVSRQRRR